jgi:hypothetical protein
MTCITYPVTYDTPARKLLGALNSSLSKRIAADGEVMSDASYLTLHLHESQIAINKCASRLVALAFCHISLPHFVNIFVTTKMIFLDDRNVSKTSQKMHNKKVK